MIIYREIEDERPLIQFFIDNGLEYSEEAGTGADELVKCWKAEEEGTGRLAGGCVLAKREGQFICDGIATAPFVRGKHVGAHMLFTMLDEVRERGASALYLVARAPGFFAKYGFVPVPREAAPLFFECFSCPQYGKSCHPEVMRIQIKE